MKHAQSTHYFQSASSQIIIISKLLHSNQTPILTEMRRLFVNGSEDHRVDAMCHPELYLQYVAFPLGDFFVRQRFLKFYCL